jgi:hypothetical protein
VIAVLIQAVPYILLPYWLSALCYVVSGALLVLGFQAWRKS